jgi:hypothetical protein
MLGLLGLLAAAALGRAVRNFDRKMVAAGQRRKIESETRAAAVATTGRVGKLAATRAADGTVQYAVQFEGDEEIHRLVFRPPATSSDSVLFHLLPG